MKAMARVSRHPESLAPPTHNLLLMHHPSYPLMINTPRAAATDLFDYSAITVTRHLQSDRLDCFAHLLVGNRAGTRLGLAIQISARHIQYAAHLCDAQRLLHLGRLLVLAFAADEFDHRSFALAFRDTA